MDNRNDTMLPIDRDMGRRRFYRSNSGSSIIPRRALYCRRRYNNTHRSNGLLERPGNSTVLGVSVFGLVLVPVYQDTPLDNKRWGCCGADSDGDLRALRSGRHRAEYIWVLN